MRTELQLGYDLIAVEHEETVHVLLGVPWPQAGTMSNHLNFAHGLFATDSRGPLRVEVSGGTESEAIRVDAPTSLAPPALPPVHRKDQRHDRVDPLRRSFH